MTIKRIKSGARMSQAVVHGSTIHTAGQVAQNARGESMENQTRAILEEIDALLLEAGTDKSQLLTAMIWITDMDDFAAMNSVWDAWVTPRCDSNTRLCRIKTGITRFRSGNSCYGCNRLKVRE